MQKTENKVSESDRDFLESLSYFEKKSGGHFYFKKRSRIGVRAYGTLLETLILLTTEIFEQANVFDQV